MNNVQYITLDIMNHKTYDYIYTKQYDVGRKVVFTIKDDNTNFDISNTECVFSMVSPDGYAVIKTLNQENGSVVLVLDDECTVTAGKLLYQLSFMLDGDVISTVTGVIICDKSPISENTLRSNKSDNIIKDLKNLYDNNVFQMQKKTLVANKWSDKRQNIAVKDVHDLEDSQLVVVRPHSSSAEEYLNCSVVCLQQHEGALTFACAKKPTNDLTVYIMTQGINSKLGNVGVIYSDVEPNALDQNEHDIWIQKYE